MLNSLQEPLYYVGDFTEGIAAAGFEGFRRASANVLTEAPNIRSAAAVAGGDGADTGCRMRT
jgi:hypothetical protein